MLYSKYIFSGLLIFILPLKLLSQGKISTVPEEIAPVNAPFEMTDLQRPEFPEQNFLITEFGAKGDGVFKNTEAFRKAIAACHEAGGGKVIVPEGRWLTGAIHLKSNVNLYIKEGAIVYFTSNLKDYLPVVHDRVMGVECYNYSPFIYAPNVSNIAITGRGILEAEGDWWWDWAEENNNGNYLSREEASKQPLETRKFGKGAGLEGLRPSFIVPWKAKNVLIEGITLKNIPLWAIRAEYTENIIVRDIKVYAVAGRHGLTRVSHNNAGVCMESSKNALIEYVHIETTDDAIVVRSGLNEDGLRINIPSENIVIRNYSVSDIQTGSGGIVFGSETSGGIRNIYVHDAVFERADRGIRFKSTRGRGNVVENIWIENIRMRDIRMEAITFNTSYPGAVPGGPAPLFRKINVSNVEINEVENAIKMSGLPEMWLKDFLFRNIRITNAKKGATIKLTENLTMENIKIHSLEGPSILINNCRKVNIRDVRLQSNDVKLMISGIENEAINVELPGEEIRFDNGASPLDLVK